MLKLHIKPKAENDLEKIYNYTYKVWGIHQAEKYQDEIFEAMKKILIHPELGPLYYHKEGNYRKLNINRHLIFYRVETNKCIVIRILHARVDLTLKL